MKGYKAFNYDFTCRNFQYEVGKTYEIEGELKICENGFHFCEELEDVFRYYDFIPTTRVAEVEILGNVITDFNKSCTDKIKIVRELSLREQLEIMGINYDTYNKSVRIYNILKFYEGVYSGSGWRVCGLGGSWGGGLFAGPFCWGLGASSSGSRSAVGGRVLNGDFVLRLYLNGNIVRINLSNKAEAKKQLVDYLSIINENENKIYFSILSRIYQELEVM